jgi:short chain dehydrogenase
MNDPRPGQPLSGAVALVTGGSRGLGRLLGQALAESGAAVGLMARSADELAAAVGDITRAGGCAMAAAGDASRPRDVERAIGRVRSQLGPIDLLVNNAGIAGPSGNTWDLQSDTWWETMQVNLGSAYASRRARPTCCLAATYRFMMTSIRCSPWPCVRRRRTSTGSAGPSPPRRARLCCPRGSCQTAAEVHTIGGRAQVRCAGEFISVPRSCDQAQRLRATLANGRRWFATETSK